MHHHGTNDSGPRPGRQTATRAVPRTDDPTARVQDLQRLVGNRATVQALGEDAPAVQRSSVQQVLRSPGRPLQESVRSDMEARLGADFTGVRMHTGAAAARSATEIGARAYTSGEHVVLGAGVSDQHTLAHELTHVIQQRSGPVAGHEHGNGLSVSDPSDRFERAAEANATRVMRSPMPSAEVQRSPNTTAARTTAIQRDIGFELETPAFTFALTPPDADVSPLDFESTSWTTPRGAVGSTGPVMGRVLAKATQLARGTDFTVEADSSRMGSDLEFVTTHFPETPAGRVRLEAAAYRIVSIARRLGEIQDGYVRTTDPTDLMGGFATALSVPDRPTPAPGRPAYPDARYMVAGDTQSANPQVTLGVPLERLMSLYERIMADPEAAPLFKSMDNTNQVMAKAHQGVERMMRQMPTFYAEAPQPASPQLRSLLFLLTQYVIGGKAGSVAYYKSIAPMLARTDFARQFTLLPMTEQNYYRLNPEVFSGLVLRSADVVHQADQPVLRAVTSPVRVTFDELTRRRWLTGIPGGIDLLSRAGYERRVNTALGAAQGFETGRSGEFESMGSMGPHLDQTAGGPGPVLEMRRIQKGMGLDSWAPFMLSTFDLAVAVNRGQAPPAFRYRRR